MRTRFPALCCLFVLAAGLTVAEDLESRAEKLENMLMSPCCMTNTVAMHESGTSQQMRLEIRDMLADDWTERKILDFYVERYGPQVLSMPEARGFNLMPYLFPLLFLVVGSAFLLVVFRRWRGRPTAEPAPANEPAVAGPWADRLKKELDKLD